VKQLYLQTFNNKPWKRQMLWNLKPIFQTTMVAGFTLIKSFQKKKKLLKLLVLRNLQLLLLKKAIL
jgi:hypothetical protein